MFRRRIEALVLCGLTLGALCGPASGHISKTDPADTDHLRPGQFLWEPQLAPSGTLAIAVNLAIQRAYVYRNDVRIGIATISSGKHGHETPAGVFTILEKDKDHRSRKYHNAPMPYMLRLTWEGISVHGGHVPGYPASHGCIRLPLAFSRLLFADAPIGTTVTISDRKASPNGAPDQDLMAVSHPLIAENEGTDRTAVQSPAGR